MADDFQAPIPGESATAYRGFCLYRDLSPAKRSLSAVDILRQKQRSNPGGMRFVGSETSDKQAANRQRFQTKKASGQIGEWSRKFNWVKRAAAADAALERRLRERQIEGIEKTSKLHSSQAEIAGSVAMKPIIRMAALYSRRGDDSTELTPGDLEIEKLGLQAMQVLPRLQQAWRLAVRIISVPDIPAVAGKRDEALWLVSTYAPPRAGPQPDAADLAQRESPEWEDWQNWQNGQVWD